MYNQAIMFEALILGIVQGLTEFLPVSSSGHLVLFHELFGSETNSLAFDVALHVGTLLAVIIYFRRDIAALIHGTLKGKKHETKLTGLLALATVPALIVGLLLGNVIEESLRSPWVVVVMLAGFGGLMLFAENQATKIKEKQDLGELETAPAVKIGLLKHVL